MPGVSGLFLIIEKIKTIPIVKPISSPRTKQKDKRI